MSRGLKETTKELVENKQNKKLKKFCLEAEPRVTRLEADFATANEAFQEVVGYFGENPKTAQPNAVFPVLLRFVTAFRKAHTSNLAKLALQRAQEKRKIEGSSVFDEDCNSPNVLPQIYDGAIDEIITDMKSKAYRPVETRHRRVSMLLSGEGGGSTMTVNGKLSPTRTRPKQPPPPVRPRVKAHS
jgi:hypothetical protein